MDYILLEDKDMQAIMHSQWIWLSIYITLMMGISLASGLFLAGIGGLEEMDGLEKFCIGFALTPILVALWMILASFIAWI